MDENHRLTRWSQWHAAWLLAASLLAWQEILSLHLLMMGSTFSFGLLILAWWGQWNPGGKFGWANGVTLLRLCGVLALPAAGLGSSTILWTAWLLFALDALDGYLARRLGLASEFGEYFDKETDAFFLLVLCLLLEQRGHVGAWILWPGLLRYGFVLGLACCPPREAKERSSPATKWIYFLTMCSLILSFSPYPSLCRPLAAIMSLALTGSFLWSLWQLYRPRPC